MTRYQNRRLFFVPPLPPSTTISSLICVLCWMLLGNSCSINVVSSFQVGAITTISDTFNPIHQPRRHYTMNSILHSKDMPEDELEKTLFVVDPKEKLYNLLLPPKGCKIDQMSGTELGMKMMINRGNRF